MDPDMLKNSDHAFIVRIWFETRENPTMPASWRAMVQHVASGEQRYFNNFAQLISFIGKKINLPPPHVVDPGEH